MTSVLEIINPLAIMVNIPLVIPLVYEKLIGRPGPVGRNQPFPKADTLYSHPGSTGVR